MDGGSEIFSPPAPIRRNVPEVLTLAECPPDAAAPVMRGNHGTAEWARSWEMAEAGFTGEDAAGHKLYLGYFEGTRVSIKTDGPILTLARSRSGKGTGVIVPNLLHYAGSCVVTDPKGELAAITARRRAEDLGQAVHVLDPWGLSGRPSSTFNPILTLDPASPDFADDAAELASFICDGAPAGSSESHWLESALGVISGLLMWLAVSAPPERRTFAELRRLLSLDRDAFNELLADMAASDAAGGRIAQAARRIGQKTPAELSGVLSTCHTQTMWMDSERIRAVTATGPDGCNPFDLDQLKAGDDEQRLTLYLCLPGERIERLGKWLRVMVGLAISTIQRSRRPKPDPSCLFYVDEAAALGYLAPVEKAVGLAAGYGVQVWTVWQDLGQLARVYGEHGARSFLGNAAVIQTFAAQDHETCERLSQMLGQASVLAVSATHNHSLTEGESHSVTTSSSFTDGFSGGNYSSSSTTGSSHSHSRSRSETRGSSFTLTEMGRPLLRPDEIRRLPASKQIIFVQGFAAILADRPAYYELRPAWGLYDPNPMLPLDRQSPYTREYVAAGGKLPDPPPRLPAPRRKKVTAAKPPQPSPLNEFMEWLGEVFEKVLEVLFYLVLAILQALGGLLLAVFGLYLAFKMAFT